MMRQLFGIAALIALLPANETLAKPGHLLEFPREVCHGMQYEEQIFKTGDTPANYTRFAQLRKLSVVCAARRLEITSPIFTNGGSVILHADELIIRAPIDTRVFFDHSDFNPYMHPEDAAVAFGGSPQNYIKLDDPRSKHFHTTPGDRAHDERYPVLYNNYYKPVGSCVSRGERTFYPAMLPGLTPALRSRDIRHDGIAPPTSGTNWSAVRSGDILIFARKIDIAIEPYNHNFEVECDLDLAPEKLLNTGGVAGGKGGAGLPSICTGSSLGMFDCTDDLYRTPGTLNGPGQRGGDAGNIRIELLVL